MDRQARIYIAGHRGLVGSALMRRLTTPSPLAGEGRGEGAHQAPYTNLLTRTHAELDLTNQAAVDTFFAQEKPDYVILAAAKVGGIHANNQYPAEFIRDNLAIQTNIIIVFDTTKPNGRSRKLMNVRRLNAMGWKAKTPLHSGLAQTYRAFLAECNHPGPPDQISGLLPHICSSP